MRHVLIIAYYFPPLGGIGSVRMTRFATFLPENGWRVTVLAPANGSYYRDPALSFPEELVLRSRSLELSRIGKGVLRTGGSDTLRAHPSGLRRGMQVAARRLAYFPDAQIGWYWPAARAGRAAMRQCSFDAIFSSAFPVTAHLIARRLHRDSGIPWVAEYRDPFSETFAGAANRRRAVALERSIAGEAAGLVMTSPSWARTHAARWDRPVSVITNGYDEVLRANPPMLEFELTYLGSLQPQWQNLRGLWQAIRNLTDAARPAVDRVCFIGQPQAEIREELAEFGLSPRVEITGLLPHGEALDRLRNAGALLLVGPSDARSELRGWIPAKTFEYLASDLPVIFVGDRSCDVARLVEQHPGCYVVDSSDVEGLTAALVDCRGKRFARDVSDFGPRELTANLAAVLDEACESHELVHEDLGTPSGRGAHRRLA